MRGIRGGSEIALAVVASSALKSVLESIINKGIGSKEDRRAKDCGAGELL
jgi:hypothetical protein